MGSRGCPSLFPSDFREEMKWGGLGFQVLHLGEGNLQNLGEDEEEGKLGNQQFGLQVTRWGSYSHVATWSSPPS